MSGSGSKNSDAPQQIEQVALITLTDEDGVGTEYEYLDTIDYKGKTYCVLYPNVESDDEDYIILEIVETDDPEYDDYRGVPDTKIMNAVFELYKERYKNS